MCALLLLASPLFCAGPPTVSLSLPAGVDPTAAHVEYYFTGAFGGYGGFLTMSADKSEYTISAEIDSKPADEISLVAYIPGCEFAAFRINLRKENPAWRQIQCVPLPNLTLRGQITPALSAADPPDIIVMIEADWYNTFFHIGDGTVPSFQVATATADQHGRFSVEIPDFCLQTDFGDASTDLKSVPSFCASARLRFLLQNPKTHEIISNLRYGDEDGDDGISLQPAYPDVVSLAFVPTIR